MSCCLPPQLMYLFCLRLLGCRRCDLRDRWDRSNGLRRGPTYRCSRGIAQVRLVDAPVSCPDETQLSLVFHGLDAVQSKLLRMLLCEFEELGHQGLGLPAPHGRTVACAWCWSGRNGRTCRCGLLLLRDCCTGCAVSPARIGSTQPCPATVLVGTAAPTTTQPGTPRSSAIPT